MNKYKPYLYGAYGSNLNKTQMSRRCPSAMSCEVIEIPDYELVFRGVADIEESYGNSVMLGLWLITSDCEEALDFYEGYPRLYTKKFIDTDAGQIMIYTMCDQSDVHPPSNNYLASIAQGCEDFSIDRSSLRQALEKSYILQST